MYKRQSEVVAKGGRGSGKSSYLSIELVWQLLRRPDCHAVVLRQVGGTLRNSVYNPVSYTHRICSKARPAANIAKLDTTGT